MGCTAGKTTSVDLYNFGKDDVILNDGSKKKKKRSWVPTLSASSSASSAMSTGAFSMASHNPVFDDPTFDRLQDSYDKFEAMKRSISFSNSRSQSFRMGSLSNSRTSFRFNIRRRKSDQTLTATEPLIAYGALDLANKLMLLGATEPLQEKSE